MIADVRVRAGVAADDDAILALYPFAFPQEDLTGLVRALLADESVVSLIAVNDAQVVGHAAFTRCGLDSEPAAIALLGPIAVHPSTQRCGIGSALIRDGIARLSDHTLCVLGDPAYYGRFGFRREEHIRTPYPIPNAWCDAWQSWTQDGVRVLLNGTLSVPAPWQEPALWSA